MKKGGTPPRESQRPAPVLLWPSLLEGRRKNTKIAGSLLTGTLPVGSVFLSPYSSTTRIVVVRSGWAQQGTWVTERRDVLADYFQIYGETDKNPVASGIGLLTDSDDTNSHAISDYAEFKTLPPSNLKAAYP